MSVIERIIQHTTEESINEALRFGNKEFQEIAKDKKFLVGLEYEFNVNDGESAFDGVLNQPEELQRLLDNVSGYVKKLATTVYDISDTNLSEVSRYANEASEAAMGGDVFEIEYIMENDVEDILTHITRFRGVILQSLPLLRYDYTGVLQSHGLWDGDSNSQEFRDITLINDYRDRLVLLGPGEKRRLLLAIGRAMSEYETFLRRILNNIRGKDIKKLTSEMFNEITRVFMAANPHLEVSNKEESKIDIIKRTHPLPPRMIDKIVPDASVGQGGELVTTPLELSQLPWVIDQMSEYIKQIGSTGKNTGLHVNISSTAEGFSSINMPKVLTLLDIDFFQNMSPNSRARPKYDPRLLVNRVTERWSVKDVENLARVYVFKGQNAFVTAYEELMNSSSDDVSAVNLKWFLPPAMEKRSDRRIEYRFFGGPGYEYRGTEIMRDIMNICYVMRQGMDFNYKRKEYIQGINRMLNRVLQKHRYNGTFGDILRRTKDTMS